jgi:sugar phosphate isomerase/epimerase
MDARQPSPHGLDRREFLTAGVAAAGLAALPGIVEAADKTKQGGDPFGGFNVGIQSYTYRTLKQPEQVLVQVQKLGLKQIEWTRDHIPLNSTDAQLKALANLCQQYQVTPVGYGVNNFSKDNGANRRLFEIGKALGLRYLSADPNPDSFDSLDKLVAEFNIAIAIHPHGPVGKQLHRWADPETILAAVKNHNRLIGTCLDTGHLIRSARPPFERKLDPAAEIRRMGDRNYAIHLKDNDNKRDVNVVFGRGSLDVPGVLRALREVKFQGTIAIEYEANPKDPTPDVQACLDVFKESVRKIS